MSPLIDQIHNLNRLDRINFRSLRNEKINIHALALRNIYDDDFSNLTNINPAENEQSTSSNAIVEGETIFGTLFEDAENEVAYLEQIELEYSKMLKKDFRSFILDESERMVDRACNRDFEKAYLLFSSEMFREEKRYISYFYYKFLDSLHFLYYSFDLSDHIFRYSFLGPHRFLDKELGIEELIDFKPKIEKLKSEIDYFENELDTRASRMSEQKIMELDHEIFVKKLDLEDLIKKQRIREKKVKIISEEARSLIETGLTSEYSYLSQMQKSWMERILYILLFFINETDKIDH